MSCAHSGSRQIGRIKNIFLRRLAVRSRFYLKAGRRWSASILKGMMRRHRCWSKFINANQVIKLAGVALFKTNRSIYFALTGIFFMAAHTLLFNAIFSVSWWICSQKLELIVSSCSLSSAAEERIFSTNPNNWIILKFKLPLWTYYSLFL